MNRNPLLLVVLLASSFNSIADSIPLLGNLKADSQQMCGKNINIQIKTVNDNLVIIGLKNKNTNKMDLFTSTSNIEPNFQYSKFTPVTFDSLSNRFIDVDDSELDIVWGSSLNEKKGLEFNLALGAHVYKCGLIQKWPSEKSNELYGEKS